MKSRHLLSVDDVNYEEVCYLFDLARRIKKNQTLAENRMRGKTLGLIFEKPSTRTWISFEVAMAQMGGTSIYLGPENIRLGEREAIKDVARVMSRYLNGMALRTFSHHLLKEFAAFAEVPVINGLSDRSHPCQALTDLFTVEEKLGPLKGKKLAYVGDANNVMNSLMLLCAKLGLDIAVATPEAYAPDRELLQSAKEYAKKSGSTVTALTDPKDAVKDADVLYTDVWVSMGQEKERTEKVKAFKKYQLNTALLKHAKPKALVMHCLPARRGEEITDEVLESKQSIVFDQAENRLHVQKAILLELIGK